MNVASFEFVVAVLAGAAVFFQLRSAPWRQAAYALANAAILYLLVPNVSSAAALALFLASGYLVARILAARPSRALLTVYLVLLIVAFLVLKQYDVLRYVVPDNWLSHSVRIVGLSYMLFRQIHFLVDVIQEQTGEISWWTYLNYQLNLFAILSGPIQRYQDFRDQWQSLRPIPADSHELLQTFLRMFLGIVKIALVAPIFLQGWQELSPALINGRVSGGKYVVEFLAAFYFYPIYLYFNFSGYCDVVIAASRLFGIRLPENFNRPYLARNVIDFWTRWHITLGSWMRDYLFLPMYKPMAERWPARASSAALVCFFLTFVAVGMWHGSSLNFIVYGLLQGAGAAVGKIWENRILRRGGRPTLREYIKSRKIRIAAIFVHLHFQCLTLLFFPFSLGDTTQMLRHLFAAIGIGGYG